MTKKYKEKEYDWINWALESKKKKLTQTLEETLNLFLSDKSIENIIKIRNLKQETVERQIIELIILNFISVDDIVKEDKRNQIIKAIQKLKAIKLSEIKEKVDDSISWFEIKCTIAAHNLEPNRVN